MARTGSSSKFVPVNLNNSYGQTLPVSNGGATASSNLGRSRSFSSSYGGMVSLSRSSRVSSSTSSSSSSLATVSASSRASKLAVPRPVNLPSLRREHSGNDPTIALVGSLGSSGWTKQSGEEIVDAGGLRSDGFKADSTSWGNRAPVLDASTQVAERRLPSAGRQSAYSPPGPSDASVHGVLASGLVSPVTKAVVFRGEDFPTLQAAAVPPSPSLPPQSRSLQHKQIEKHFESPDEQRSMHQQECAIGDDRWQSTHFLDQQLQPAQPVRMQVRGSFPDRVDSGVDRASAYPRGPSPLIRLTHTSNWADDERETLSSFRPPQESMQSDWTESNNGFRTAGNWPMDHSADIDFRRPMARIVNPGRNDTDSSMHKESALKGVYGKDGDLKRGPLNGGRFELDYRGDFDRVNNNLGRNDFLKRGWSFSAAESNLNRDARYVNSSNGNERERYTIGRVSFREGNNFRLDTPGRDRFTRDGRPGLHFQDVGQGQEAKFGKDVFIGRQGFPGGLVSTGPRSTQRPGFSYSGSDASLPSKPQSGVDYRRDNRASGVYGQVHNEDPFLADGISTRPTSFYVSQPKMKKGTSKDNDFRDPARESFEAELERVEKMLEQERQRAVEERERAIEVARQEQEEQERLAREEEEMRLKLEEEERQASYRAQREAEEAARKVEEARKAREEEKRMADLEEDRRKEAARRKLLELEERMAKRESEKRREEASQKERGSTLRPVTGEVSIDHQDSGMRNNETGRESHWKLPASGKADQLGNERVLPVNSSSLPSILRSPRLSVYAKEENGSSTEGARLAQTWKREALDNGHDPRSAQRGPVNSLHLRIDRSQQEHEDQQRGPSFRNLSVRKSPVQSTDTQNRASSDPHDAEERNWWVRETQNKSQYSVATYPDSADSSEYPTFGRLRQSLPKQPRVLPPPPAQAISRKQAVQPDDTHSGSSAFSIEHIEVAPPSKEDYPLTTGGESTVCHEAILDDSLVTDAHVPEQFDSVPSEEVVLSDAGSQFSDDTAEDVVTPAYQEQELHSDAVSETYTEGEVDEISDLTEAQESSEDFESHKPMEWEECNGAEKADIDGESFEPARKDVHGCLQGQYDVGKEGLTTLNEEQEQEERVLDECRDNGKNITNSCLTEDVAKGNMENLVHVDECVTEEVGKQMVVTTESEEDGQEPDENAEELASETIVQDPEIQPLLHQVPFLPVGTGDASQTRHLEGVTSRQALTQQFQQPFSFMAVPLPQSNTLNHAGASLPMLSSVHTLPVQQELPFHLQLGLLPGMPLMPNAIQIGSIQMPLHIHPQIPQLAHLHGQHAPVFQFGQIGPSLSISQPLPMTHMSQPAVQMHHVFGQGSLSQHHHSQAEFVSIVETANDSGDFSQHAKFGDVAAVEGAAVPSAGHNLPLKEGAELKQEASGSNEGSTNMVEREVHLPLMEQETQSPAISLSKLDSQMGRKTSTEESSWVGDSGQGDHNARPDSRQNRGGRRRSHGPRYQGILGRGRGRFHGGQSYFHQAPHLTAESWPEAGTKRFSRGKAIRRNYRRTEYRVREPLSLFDGESAAAEIIPGPASTMEDSREAWGYRYVKKGPGSHSRNAGDENGQLIGAGSRPTQIVANGDQPANPSITATTSKTKGLPRKYEVDSAEDAPFRTGVVCVFEQPGIETPNDKDDFIKVRSKRQLLRELREQREKESKTKSLDPGSRDQAGKKQQRSSAKAGMNSGMAGANLNKNIVKRRSFRSGESGATDGRVNMPSSSNGVTSAASMKRNLTSPNPGRATTASKAAVMELETTASFAHDNHVSEQSTTAAWGGQRSNQKVVSLTQIQLEEAMKPFRLDVPFSDSARISEKVTVTLEPGLPCSSALSVEKTVPPIKASGALSSLLAGEKIQFGAVTSPTLIPPTPLSAVRTGSPLGFGSDSSHVPSHMNSSFVTNFLESHLDVTFSLKGDSSSKHDGFEGKVVDLEAEAEAAASAVAAAAISSEDSIESHPNTRVSEINAGCTTISSANSLTGQIHNNSASDNPIAVALPADLSVETPPSLFQGSSMTLSNSSGVLVQSIPGGAPAFSCLEMGPLLGGPGFNFGPREDASLASMEPGLSGWQQQRHIGTADSFYGAPPFLSPAGLSSIQGHPHMLVYANPYTPVGQFGQLGVSFMGAAYHPSGKQPDWTHIPMPSSSSGTLALNDGDLSAGSNGLMASQHLSNLIPTQRTQGAGSSVMPVATPPNLFDAGFAAPFQMDGLMQSHWSKAPAPPVHSVPISGSTLPLQNMPLSRPAVDLNMQFHPSRVLPNQAGQLSHLNESSSGFHQRPVLNPVSSSAFSSVAESGSQFPDELGLVDSMPAVNTLQSDAGGPLSDTGHVSGFASVENSGIRMQRGRRPSRSSQGLYGSNSSSSREMISGVNCQDQSRSGHLTLESQSKYVGQIGSPGHHTNILHFVEQRASKQALPRESVGGDWSRGGQRKGASGRVSSSDRGGSVLPSKLKQIYVAKPAADSRKLGAACS